MFTHPPTLGDKELKLDDGFRTRVDLEEQGQADCHIVIRGHDSQKVVQTFSKPPNFTKVMRLQNIELDESSTDIILKHISRAYQKWKKIKELMKI